MNELMGRKVTSSRFGDGIIVNQQKTRLSVSFFTDRIRELEYPDCFDRQIINLVDDDFGSSCSYQEIENYAKLMPDKCSKNVYTITTFDSVDKFVTKFNNILEKEKYDLKEKGGRRQRLFDGKLIEEKNGRYLYSFESDSEQHFPDDTSISIWISNINFPAMILNVVDFTMTIAVHEDFGETINTMEFSAEPWQLLEELQNRLRDINSAPSPIVNDLVCTGHLNQKKVDNSKIAGDSDLAIAHSFDNTITFVWGPPGTGKTETLAKIALKHINESSRVLMLSYSNVSVDGAILRVRKLDGNFSDGRLLRYGYPRDKELLENEVLTSYNLALNKYPDLKRERNALIAERKKTERNTTRYVEINKLLGDIREKLDAMEKSLVSQARFVATTISKTVVDKLLYSGSFDVVLFDEASMAYIPQVIFAASLAKSRFICLGDFNQLPPISQSNQEMLNWDIFQYCGITNAVAKGYDHNWLCLLNTQYRMHPQIADFSSRGMYNSLIKSAPGMEKSRSAILESEPFSKKPMSLVDLSGMMTVCKQTTDKSHMNVLSSLIAFGIALEVSQKHEVGIISPYSAQAKLYNAMSRDASNAFQDLKRIFSATVHQFQGSEKDVIIYDSVDCYRQRYIGKMLTHQENNYANRLFNVAITRSKGKFIALANVDYFERKNLSRHLLLGQFLNKYKQAGMFIYGEKIPALYTRKINEMFRYYHDDSSLIDFETDINAAKDEIRMDIPEGIKHSQSLESIYEKLQNALGRGINVVIRAEKISELPAKWRQLAKVNQYAWNPITIIDRKKIWFGMPYSDANFVSENEIINSKYHPVIRFVGAFTATSLIGFLEMNKLQENCQFQDAFNVDTVCFCDFMKNKVTCPACGSSMKMRTSRRNNNYFLGCSNYPKCQEIVEITVNDVEQYLAIHSKGVRCPECSGTLRATQGRRGIFFRCTQDPMHCFSLNDFLK